ncbi:hypothetical protein [Haloferula sp. BvORR071]|uniref:hypothetical protein n=1 Tax=Haloferula sp. BvORR071 TaxID=1396141 RepID=UPI00054D6EDC|nr:hypothetical protein [Haloferula sp. BvORR071]
MKTLAIRTLLGAGLVLGVCGNAAKAEDGAAVTEAAKPEGYVLAAKESKLPAKGVTHTDENSAEMKDAKMSIDASGKKMEGTMNRSEKSVDTWVYVADNKARRTLTSKASTNAMTMNGANRPVPGDKDPLVGVPVIVEYKDGTYVVTLEAGTATPEQSVALEKLSGSLKRDSQFAMYGDTPRKVGDKWNVDPKNVGGFGDMQDLSGTFTMELVEIKEFQGVPCAVLKSQVDIKGSSAEGGPGQKTRIQVKGEAICHRSLADKTDLEVKTTSIMTMDGSPAPQVTMHVEGPFNMTQKTTVTR